MELKGRFQVLRIKKPTTAKFFCNLKPGDEFELSYNINGGYNHAPVIKIIQDGQVVHRNNAIQLSNNLKNFEVLQL